MATPEQNLTAEQRQELNKQLLAGEQVLWAGRTSTAKTSLWNDIEELLSLSTSEVNVTTRQYVSHQRTYAVTNQRVLLVDDPSVAAQQRQIISLESVDPQSVKIIYPERKGTLGSIIMEQNKQRYAFGRIDNPQMVKDLIVSTFSR